MNKLFPICLAIIVHTASSVCAELPDAFVEYVESTNAATYVDTGILPVPSTTRMVVKLTPTAVDRTMRGIFGSRTSSYFGSGDSAYVLLESKKFRVDWIGARTYAFEPSTNAVYTFDMIANRAFIDNSFYASPTYKASAAGKALYLFNMNDNGIAYTGLPQKLFACRIYTNDTTLAANYIPCIKGGVAGLYDSISGNILYSSAYPLQEAATPNSDIRLNAGKIEAKLEVSAGAGGSVDTAGIHWVEVGSIVTLSATPNADKQAQWASNHDDATYTNRFAGNAISFAMPAYPVTVDATFVADGYAPFVTDLTPLVDAAAEGDEIMLLEGTYVLTKQLSITNKAVTITGAGRDKTIIQSAPNAFIRGVYMTTPSLIRNLTVTGFTNELSGSGVYMTAGTADTVRVSYNQNRRHHLCNGVGIYLTGGSVTNSLIDNNSASSSYGGMYGIGVYMTGGIIVDSAIKDNWRERSEFYGGGVAIVGAGTLLGCRIKNNGSRDCGNGSSNTRGMGVYMAGNGLVDRCAIVSNDIHGVWMNNGTMRNSLVCGHKTSAAGYTAGVEISGGHLYNCTVADNLAPASYAGLKMTGGTAANNIVYGNGTSGDILVSGGIFNTNIVDSVASITTSKATGNMATDPIFSDPANGNFSIGFSSPAVDAGATMPSYAIDFAGTSRPQGDAYDIGYHEYLSSVGGALQCAIIVSLADWPSGAAPSASARVIGGSGSYTYAWYVDDVLSDQTSDTPTFTGLSNGKHTLKLVVNDGVDFAEDEYVDALNIHPFTVYVDLAGSDTYPYDTAARAAHTVNDALDAAWKSASTTTTVYIADGTYFLTSELALATPCHLLGTGRDSTILSGGKLISAHRGISIASAGSIVRNLTITGCTNNLGGTALKMTADGLVDNVRLTDNRVGFGYGSLLSGGGISMSDGIVTNCLIDANIAYSSYGVMSGIGVYITGGLLTDSEIADNWRARTQLYGAGIYAGGGTVRRCHIHGNSNKNCGTDSCTYGMGLYMNGNAAVAENCIIEDNGIQGVYLKSGTLFNTLITGHAMTSASYAGGVYQLGGLMYNCTVTGNTSADSQRANLHMTSGTAVNNIFFEDSTGSCLVTGGTFNTNLVDMAVAIGTGNIVASTSPFVSQMNANYHIRSASAAFNTGNNGLWSGFAKPTDLAGGRRIRLKIVDLGCYESTGGGGSLIMLR